MRLVYANPSAFYLGGGLPACHRYSNQVASVFAHQLHGVRLERFCPWQCVFFLYLHPLVPDGTERDRVEIYRLLCGDCGYTAALYLPPPGHRNYFVDKAKEGSVLKRLEDAKLRQDYEAALKTLDSIPPEVIRFYENRTQEPAMRHDK